MPYVSSGRILSRPTAHAGPSSRPSVSAMIVTPVSASPAMIARSTGAAPRQRGSSDGWTLRIGPKRLSSGSRMSAPNAHSRILSTPGLGDLLDDLGLVDALGLEQVDAELAGGVGDRRRGELAAAALRRVGPGDDERRPVLGVGEAAQDGRGELRGPEVGGPQTGYAAVARSASRRVRIASLRWSREVRSRMRIPSRWSVSCWMTRASRPEASMTTGSP